MTTTNTQSTTETLEPCPFCPYPTARYFAVRTVGWQHDRETTQRVVAICSQCGAQGPAFGVMSFNNAETAAQYWNRRTFIFPATAAPVAEQRQLEIALGYIKRAANRELPKLPCRVDEMTERELEVFKAGAAAVGNLQFIARELDALPAATTAAPQQSDTRPSCWHCGVVLAEAPKLRCDDCPTECDVEGCDELGCAPSTAAPVERFERGVGK